MNSVRRWFVFVAVVASLVAGQLRYAVVFDDLNLLGSGNPAPNDNWRNSPDGAVNIDERREHSPLAGLIGADYRLLQELALTASSCPLAEIENDRSSVAEVAIAGMTTEVWSVEDLERSFPAKDLRFNGGAARPPLDFKYTALSPSAVVDSGRDSYP